MSKVPRETAVILANGVFRTPFAKTAHGLVRGPCRYHVVGIVDDSCAGEDAGEVLTAAERLEAESLVELAEFLSLLHLRALHTSSEL